MHNTCTLHPIQRLALSLNHHLLGLNITMKEKDFCFEVVYVGRDSSVVTATRYRLDAPGIETRWGQDFPHPSSPTVGPT